jgi:hypothetical protein
MGTLGKLIRGHSRLVRLSGKLDFSKHPQDGVMGFVPFVRLGGCFIPFPDEIVSLGQGGLGETALPSNPFPMKITLLQGCRLRRPA